MTDFDNIVTLKYGLIEIYGQCQPAEHIFEENSDILSHSIPLTHTPPPGLALEQQ